MVSRRKSFAIATGAIGALLTVAPVLACYNPNHGAAASIVTTNYGLKGLADVGAANTINWATTAIVHPAQVTTG